MRPYRGSNSIANVNANGIAVSGPVPLNRRW
jgi:hypothetical protein